MKYTIYDLKSGKIDKLIICPGSELEFQYEAKTQGSINGFIADSVFYINTETLEPTPIPTQDSPDTIFDWATKQWYDPRTLEDLKDAKWAQVKAAREAAIDAALPTPYGTFDSDASARTSITDAVLMLQSLAALGQPTTVDFTLADNSVVTLTTAEMVNVGLLLGQKVQAAYAAARALRAQIEASTTPAEVAAVAW